MPTPKSTFKAIAVTALAVIAAVALNPSPERHREKIREAVSQRSQLESLLGVGQLEAFIAQYRSIGVASYTVVDGKVASIGLLGAVFVVQ